MPGEAAAQVWVARDNGRESLFATGPSGTRVADWIVTGSVYEFRLYVPGPPRRLVATIQVTQRSDSYTAVKLAFAGLLFLGLLIIVAARQQCAAWLMETAFPALIVSVLLVKLTHLTTSLKPMWGELPPYRRTITATLAVLVFFWAVVMLLDLRRRAIAFVILAVVLTTVGVADLVHVRYFDEMFTLTQLSTAPQLLSVTSSVRALFQPADGLYFVDCLILIVFLPVFLRLATRIEPLSRRTRFLLAVLLLVTSAAAAFPAWRLIRSQHSQRDFSRRFVAQKIGVLAYHVNDLATTVGAWTGWLRSVSVEDRDAAIRWVAQYQTRKENRSPLFGVARGRNLILISAESLNAFPIGLALDGRPITPHLDALAAESLRFTNFFDQTHLGATSDGEFLALQSLYPLPDGPVAMRFATNSFLGLPAILAHHDYSTFSAVGASSETWNAGQMHRRHGFARSYFEREFTVAERIGGWISDREFFAQMLPHLKMAKSPFLAFLLSSSSHLPYELPENRRTLPVGYLSGTLLGRYLQSVHYLDGVIGEFIEQLRQDGLLDRSVVAIYGDHQGFIDDLGQAATLKGVPKADAIGRWRIRKTVPFLVRLPGAKAAGDRSAIGGHLDIAPTLLALLGIDTAGTVMLGRDLTQGEDQLVIFRDGSFVAQQGYYLNQPRFPICYDSMRVRVDCGPFAIRRREVVERLRVSDAIIRANLVPHVIQGMQYKR